MSGLQPTGTLLSVVLGCERGLRLAMLLLLQGLLTLLLKQHLHGFMIVSHSDSPTIRAKCVTCSLRMRLVTRLLSRRLLS